MNQHKGSKIAGRMYGNKIAKYSIRPPFPREVNIELSNVCNHSCSFCAYRDMEREKGSINVQKLEIWLKQAYKLGSRELGLHSGEEPFASQYLEHFIAYSKQLGYEYVYISTNGSLATHKRMKDVIDNGIDSIKFSINAGDKETYKKVHGKDHFERVLDNLRYAKEYRGEKDKPYLAISFVITNDNKHSVNTLKTITNNLVDEFLAFPASNQNGQMTNIYDNADKKSSKPQQNKICPFPFNKLHISREGFIRACCNDYENLLALENINDSSLEEAFYGKIAQEFRQRHLDDNLEGTLCFNCIHNQVTPVQPINPSLYFTTHNTDIGPKISNAKRILGISSIREMNKKNKI